MQEAAAKTYEYAGPGYLAYIPGGGLYTAALAEFMAQGVNRYINLWQPSPGDGPDRAERRPLALRPVRLPRRRTRPPHVRRLHGELLRDRHGAARQAGRGLPRRHVLRQRAGPRQRVEGREPGRLLPAEPAAGPDRPPAADGRGGAPRHGRRPIARPASDRSWWCRRPARRTPARSIRSTTSPTSRPSPSMWMHVDAAYGGFFQLTERGRARFARDRARRLGDARSAQGAVPAVRDRFARGPRRRCAPRRALRGRRVPAGPGARGRAAELHASTRPSSRARTAGCACGCR